MARPGLDARTRSLLTRVTGALARPGLNIAVFGGGLVLTVGAHVIADDPQLAWLTAPLVFVAGLVGGVRGGIAYGVAAGAVHAAVDIAFLAAGPGAMPGLAVRILALAGCGLIGATGAQLEGQRTQALQRVVREDSVTGLLNVRAFYDELSALREQDRPFTILLADIRGMRALNDRYGHPTGTEAMRALAHVLRRSAGQDVLASRLGSDEVAIALIDADRNRCRSVVARIVERLHDEQVSLPDGERFEVHAAYGIARFPEDGDDEVAVLRAADRAKERAKSAGMDRVGTAEGDVL